MLRRHRQRARSGRRPRRRHGLAPPSPPPAPMPPRAWLEARCGFG